MSILGIIGTVVGTLVFAWLFDHFFEMIFNRKRSLRERNSTLKDFSDIAKKIDKI